MLDTLLVASPWPALALALALTALDLLLSVRERQLYYQGARELIFIEGQQYALDGPYQERAGWQQFWSRRYTQLLIGTAVAVVGTWFIFTRWNDLPRVFVFAMGGLLLFELVECVRLARFVNLFRLARRAAGMKGRLEVQGWVLNNLFVIDQYAFALVFLLAFLASGDWFFLGGSAACFIFGHKLRDFVVSRQARKS